MNESTRKGTIANAAIVHGLKNETPVDMKRVTAEESLEGLDPSTGSYSVGPMDINELDSETALALYEDMQLGRQFEDKCAEMYYRGKMFGFVHLYCGQEVHLFRSQFFNDRIWARSCFCFFSKETHAST